jgi:outer membrane protein assembly factor BamA
MGPLRLSYGHPLNAKADDRIQHLQFQFGQVF